MIETTNDYNSFWLIICSSITLITIVIAVIVGLVKTKFKDSDSENYRFKTHVEEHMDNNKVHIDTTSKMKDMHDNVIKVDFTEKHEKEFDSLERGLKDLDNKVKDLKIQVDKLIERVIELENNR